MTKADLVDKVAAQTGLTKAASEKAVAAFLSSVEEELVAAGKITLTGFGTFAVEERKERVGRNPRTGQAIDIPASKVVRFRPGKTLKDSVK